MASLYIKNSDTADLASEVASLLGTSKTAAVHDALLHRKRELERAGALTIHERMEAWRQAHPLGEPTGMVADKAFYDSLNDEDED
ncbi:type II toxin-antitoxin system VapB family antitoxin [Sphingomonas sp. RP10(2022)]|uniref:Type II toxin-antitoxin system VapB family antitoxin n=1 Tax=Sphingomonas liriopis TaxID=2949094 RepID=A0A9X2HRM8_9SPHN|nr:type II toxin-antitoxin system VapB family antitoxin [Sphingomonas liriopis]MCP3735938.1 type II toxin-antitoxin system VapB family antitoxin [Sphingomonas liriopis]